jgi:hypothetical protein
MNKVGVIATEWVYDRFPRVDEVILTQVLRGEGKDYSDPVRGVVQVHMKDGTFIAEMDPLVNMEKLRGRLQRAEALLKAAPPLGQEDAKWRERVDDFFDPEPLA